MNLTGKRIWNNEYILYDTMYRYTGVCTKCENLCIRVHAHQKASLIEEVLNSQVIKITQTLPSFGSWHNRHMNGWRLIISPKAWTCITKTLSSTAIFECPSCRQQSPLLWQYFIEHCSFRRSTSCLVASWPHKDAPILRESVLYFPKIRYRFMVWVCPQSFR